MEMAGVHGSAELSSGAREDLFSVFVSDHLVNIVCGGCGLACDNHGVWEEHVRDMTIKEDEHHTSLFTVQITSNVEKLTSDNFKESSFKKFPCPECGRYFKTEEDVDCHRLCVSTSVKLVCPQCSLLVPDMEEHLVLHGDDVQCGECGDWCGHVDTHMVEAHSGYASVLVTITDTCAGDGTARVIREIALATNARFLASEVKPVDWSENTNTEDKEENIRPYRFNKASERDKALMPPDTLPDDFFDSEGKRIWVKLPSNAHQCELCGFKAITKNKYREKQDHISKWHFAKRLEMIIPQNTKKPFLCPDCHYTGKDRQCVLRHYTGKHAVLETWTNEFLQAMNNKNMSPTLMYLVENVNFNAKPSAENKKEIIQLQNAQILKKSDSFNCILCKDEPSFASKKGLALHVEIAHTHSRETTSDFLKKSIGFTFKEVVQSCEDTITDHVSYDNNKSSTFKRPGDTPSVMSDIAIVKKKKRPVPGLIKINTDSAPISEDIEEIHNLELKEVKDKGLFCKTCDDVKIATLQSFIELRQHVANKHVNLLVENEFLPVRNIPCAPGSKPFTYYLCTKCGKCFPQSSPPEKLRNHSSRECNNNNPTLKPLQAPCSTNSLPNTANRLENPAFPEELAQIIKEISPSVSIIPKSNKSMQQNSEESDLRTANEESMGELVRKDIKAKGRDPCPCQYCQDPKFAHIKLHKCYVEETCNKTFSKIAHLKAHIRCHNNERPFACDWQGCGKTFVRPDELKRHAWIHTKEDRFKCTCGKGYSRADHFRAHAVKCDFANMMEGGMLVN